MPKASVPDQVKYEIIRCWLTEHLPYREISRRLGVSVGLISKVVSEFRGKAKALSLEEAAKMYGVWDEVKSVLELSSDLRRAGIPVSEAREGVALLKELRGLGVSVADVREWVNLCRKITQQEQLVSDYIQAAIKLSKLEGETGLSYRELLKDYEVKLSEFRGLSEKLKALKDEVKRLEGARERIEGELTSKRKELDELNRKVSELRDDYESLRRRYDNLIPLVDDLQRRRNQYVEEIAKYEMEYGKYKDMVEKVVANIEGRGLTRRELRDIIITTLRKEAERLANNILTEWLRDGYVVIIKEFKVGIKCPKCLTTFTLPVTKDFMTRLVRGYGIYRLKVGPYQLMDIPRPPSPGSTTISCPSCNEVIEVTYEHIVKELKKQTIEQGRTTI